MVEEFSSKRLCHVRGGRRSSREEDEHCLAVLKMSALHDQIQIKEDWCEICQAGSWDL